MAGNKADLASRRAVETSDAQAYAEEAGLIFFETSAKDAQNVNNLFQAIGKVFFFKISILFTICV